ncbi:MULTISPECIES: ABC transporter ATP-binding protein [Campylobacter]|uniref:ATP-binding cassette domain-containing protein n=1 Tax=Campylobacter vicugnae TaxID=1660076 RepID=A0A1X9SZZ9_9BACT|nr:MULTISPECIES: ATP-binding cassette domain-containing protein [Campylobacter]MCR8689509.1 ATP-binding cassette domain-containing protein [Campylobacter sp. RM9264]ARR01872.1 lipid asymmetry ABC transporter MlaABCDEF, ATPase component MlaF [Campylobacter sp. RM8964]MBE6429263.1 ATP-binding cassette domain-containing protein [Campylobacter sp.]MBQ7136112.1 ATP-binding cassette domain-containing protein [Campylobacter sp.]MBQ8608963.1 ATP-binding cassette domain-containing protein [Campylobacte
MIIGKDIVTTYNGITIHEGANFHIKSGEIYGLLGGSGSGKTTLLKTMIFLKEPTSGSVKINGVDIWRALPKEQQDMKLQIGVMFQFGALFSNMNVLDNIGIMLREYSEFDPNDIDEIAKMWLIKVGLKPNSMTLYPSELSGGMKKRVALARALALSPRVLFLDEPNSGLDPISARAMDRLICDIRDSLGITVVMVTHDIDSIFNILDRFLIVDNKKIVFEGDLKQALEFKDNPLKDLFAMR